MRLALNSKFFADLDVEALGEKIAALGYDGIDLCVRPGHLITPDNVAARLPEAVEKWRQMGLDCPSVAAPVDFNDAQTPAAERLYAACATAGVGHIKIGYWYYAEGDDFWALMDQARRGLEGFAALSRRYGVKTCCHTHSGPCLGSNAAGLMHLIGGFAPQEVGAYIDFGHLALDGEDAAMAIALVRRHLALVGVKDGHQRPQPDKTPPYGPAFARLGAGSVDWRRVLGLLRKAGYDGALLVHTEYDFDESIIRQVGFAGRVPEGLEAQARGDAAYLRRLLEEQI